MAHFSQRNVSEPSPLPHYNLLLTIFGTIADADKVKGSSKVRLGTHLEHRHFPNNHVHKVANHVITFAVTSL